ncbi:hypothetical protein GGI09_000492 [Coemansia sp. S100]|nr:hypothetical protein GGI09_000492 [Coemansia sp. S100]
MKEYCLLSTLVAAFLATSLWAGHLNVQAIFYQLHGILLLGLLDKSSWAFRVIFVVATACLGIRDIFVLLHGVLLLDLLDRCSWAYRVTYTVATVSQGTSMASDSPAPAKFSKGTQVGEPPAATISTYIETDKSGSIDMGAQVDEPQAVMTTSTATQTVATASTSTATQTAATVSVAIETQTAPTMSMSTTTKTVAVRSVATQPAKMKRKVKSATASTQTAVTVGIATETQTAAAVTVGTTTETAMTKSVATQTPKTKRKVKTAPAATATVEAKSTGSSTSSTATPADDAKRAPSATATDKAKSTGSSTSSTAMATCIPADKLKSFDLTSMGDVQMGSTDTGVLNSGIPADDARNAPTGVQDDDVQMDAEYTHPHDGDVVIDAVNTVARDDDVPMGTADIDSHDGDVPMDSIPTSAQDGDIQMVAAYTNLHDGDIAMDAMDTVGRDDDVPMGAVDTDPCDDGIVMDDVEGSVDKASSTLSREQATVNMNTDVPMPLISGGNTEVRAPSFCASVTSDTIRSPSGNTASIGYSQNTLFASPRGVNNHSWTNKQHSADVTRKKLSESTVNKNPTWFASSYMNNPAAFPSNMADERDNYYENSMAKIREWVESKHIEFAASDNFTTSDNIRRTYHDSLANDKLVDMYSRTTTWSLRRGGNKSDKAITSGPSAPYTYFGLRNYYGHGISSASYEHQRYSFRQSDTAASALNTSRASTTANASATPAKPKNPYSTSMFRTFKKPNGKKPN